MNEIERAMRTKLHVLHPNSEVGVALCGTKNCRLYNFVRSGTGQKPTCKRCLKMMEDE